MFGLIFVIIIIYLIYKNSNIFMTPARFKTILSNKGFRNINIVKQIISGTWITADYHGDNYIFSIIKPSSTVSKKTIDELYNYAISKHYHNIILVPGNSTILTTANTAISNYHIQIWNTATLNRKFGKEENYTSSAIVEKAPINDHCKIDAPFDPIQDGSKVNSIFGNFFNNKIEKL